jgi:AAA family ATP:ADP antiporter
MFIGIYSKMASILDKKPLFYATCIPFFAFFFLFDAIIYPNRGSIQPSLSTVQSIMRVSPSGGGASAIFAKLFANWTSALFYIVAEVYSSVSVGILFWQYANDVVSVSQAKRFYPLFAQMSGIAPIVAGQYVVRYASRAKDFGQSLRRLTWMVNFSGLMICLFYRWSNAYIEKTAGVSEDAKDDSARGELLVKQKKKKKSKMTMIESARFLASSEYLRLIATLVVGYGEYAIRFDEVLHFD